MGYQDQISAKRQQKIDASKQDALTSSLGSVSSDIRTLLASLETSGAKKLDKQVVDAISSLGNAVQALKSLKVEGDNEVKDLLRAIAAILSNLNVRPVVNVPKTQVVVKEPNLDPIMKAMQSGEKMEEDPLCCYKAQDINDDDPHTQYIGFIKADGGWYIIENNDTTNTLRYKFGKSGYSQAFKDAKKLNYSLYSEALREVSS